MRMDHIKRFPPQESFELSAGAENRKRFLAVQRYVLDPDAGGAQFVL